MAAQRRVRQKKPTRTKAVPRTRRQPAPNDAGAEPGPDRRTRVRTKCAACGRPAPRPESGPTLCTYCGDRVYLADLAR